MKVIRKITLLSLLLLPVCINAGVNRTIDQQKSVRADFLIDDILPGTTNTLVTISAGGEAIFDRAVVQPSIGMAITTWDVTAKRTLTLFWGYKLDGVSVSVDPNLKTAKLAVAHIELSDYVSRSTAYADVSLEWSGCTQITNIVINEQYPNPFGSGTTLSHYSVKVSKGTASGTVKIDGVELLTTPTSEAYVYSSRGSFGSR